MLILGQIVVILFIRKSYSIEFTRYSTKWNINIIYKSNHYQFCCTLKYAILSHGFFIFNKYPNDKDNTINFGQYDKILLPYLDTNTHSQIIIIKDKHVSIPELNNQLPSNTIIYDINANHIEKSYTEAGEIIKYLQSVGLSRKSIIIGIGGGALGDIIGFISFIYMRGVKFIFIPTTMMSQCDCIIGKIAVNHSGSKNLIGIFGSPYKSIIDINFLKTCKNESIYEGLIEIFKHNIIYSQSNMNLLLQNFPDLKVETFQELIYESLQTKHYFVKQDPYDIKGMHKGLSLGHTLSNYLEDNFQLTHGEGVLVGIIMETLLSYQLDKISNDRFQTIINISRLFLSKLGSYIIKKLPTKINQENLMQSLKKDKINHGDGYNFTIPLNEGFEIVNINNQEKIIGLLNKSFVFIKKNTIDG